jgi:hypothetical protein
MAEVCTDFGAELREFNGETDQVHLLVHYPPKFALSRLVNSLKGVSARRLRQEFPTHIRKYRWGEHFWSPPTSQAPAAAHHYPSSRTTSKTRNAPPKSCPRYAPAQKRDAIPPGRQRPVFPARITEACAAKSHAQRPRPLLDSAR